MIYNITWLKGADVLSTENTTNFPDARDIARSRLATHRTRSGATHVEVHSDDGVLLFDSRVDLEARAKRPSIAPHLAKRWALQ